MMDRLPVVAFALAVEGAFPLVTALVLGVLNVVDLLQRAHPSAA